MPFVTLAYAENHLSELIAKCDCNRERFIISGRNKIEAALVSLEDLQIIEQHEEIQGLAAVAGKWQGFDEVADALTDFKVLRVRGGSGRDVSF